MNDRFQPEEPQIDPMEDTGRVEVIRAAPRPTRIAASALMLLAALALTIATVVMVLAPAPGPTDSSQTVVLSTAAPTNLPPTSQPTQVSATSAPVMMQATLDPGLMAELLGEPVNSELASSRTDGIAVVRNVYNPFTIIPDRPRSEVIEYEIQEGDTIFSIAERYGLKPETIAWSNDRSIIGGLRPGRMINILPVDGAYWTVVSEQTIQQVADQFRVDPYAIIDSEYNDMFGMTPETVLPVGAQIVVPGGEAETITWTARVETRDTSTSGAQNAQSSGGQIIFEPGDPGSCGWVDNPGNPGAWTNPMNPGSYQWTRGFSSWHTGVDLAGPEGTPAFAANGGTVVFAGWNSYGYGNAVVLAHGPFMTLYGHLSSINVGCGQYVSPGQVIGGIGASGNASGPHLHFEIRYNNVAQDPTFTLPF